ncbi:Uncharacterised protein [Mycobacteroides abscessus subsp. abscessus]|nr:Uncharacterised protein [Mycobacteroides abscessus subsp. abscessus]
MRRPPTITVLPLACKASASSKPIPLVAPGMNTVLPEICIGSPFDHYVYVPYIYVMYGTYT